MRKFINEIRFMLKDAWQSRGTQKIPVDDSLAKTLRDSSHVRGANHGGMARASTEQHHKIAAEGAQRYVKSFEKGRDLSKRPKG